MSQQVGHVREPVRPHAGHSWSACSWGRGCPQCRHSRCGRRQHVSHSGCPSSWCLLLAVRPHLLQVRAAGGVRGPEAERGAAAGDSAEQGRHSCPLVLAHPVQRTAPCSRRGHSVVGVAQVGHRAVRAARAHRSHNGLPLAVCPPRGAVVAHREQRVMVILRAQERQAPPPLETSRRTIGAVEPHHSHRGRATPRTPAATSPRARRWAAALLRVVPQVRTCGRAVTSWARASSRRVSAAVRMTSATACGSAPGSMALTTASSRDIEESVTTAGPAVVVAAAAADAAPPLVPAPVLAALTGRSGGSASAAPTGPGERERHRHLASR